MSKKLYSSLKWKRKIASAQARELSKATKKRNAGFAPSQSSGAPAPRKHTVTLLLPEAFSIVKNPEQTINFLQDFELQSRKYNINLDLRNIDTLTIEAITALTALVKRLRHSQISGNSPNDIECQNLLAQSGFLEHVRQHNRFPSTALTGKMSREESTRVEGTLAKQLIHRVTSTLYGSPVPCQPAYRALIESMSNTIDHAARTRMETERWWATAHGDAKNRRGRFAFLDTGVGIFMSRRLGSIKAAYEKVSKIIGLRNNSDILKEMLHGKVESSTGLAYRGKGLPSMYNALKANRLKSLVIVSNDVYADVGLDEFRTLKNHFGGTVLYWEI